jgi:hypothetical protein
MVHASIGIRAEIESYSKAKPVVRQGRKTIHFEGK